MSEIILTAIMFFLFGFAISTNTLKKNKPAIDEEIEKNYNYYKNLATSLLSDVSNLRNKNNNLLEENWKIKQENENWQLKKSQQKN